MAFDDKTDRTEVSAVPLYQQVMDDLKGEIARGVYASGSRIPSEMELAKSYGVGRITVRRSSLIPAPWRLRLPTLRQPRCWRYRLVSRSSIWRRTLPMRTSGPYCSVVKRSLARATCLTSNVHR